MQDRCSDLHDQTDSMVVISWRQLLLICLVKGPHFSLVVQIVPQDGKASVLSVDLALTGLAGAVAPFVGTSLFGTLGCVVFSAIAGVLISAMLVLVHAGALIC